MKARRSVFEEMSSIFRSFDALVSRALEDPLMPPSAWRGRHELPAPAAGGAEGEVPWMRTLFPAVECRTRGKEMVLRAELPGGKPEDLEVTLEAGHLTLRGRKSAEIEEEKEGGWLFREVDYGRFERRFPLPEGVEADDVKADLRQRHPGGDGEGGALAGGGQEDPRRRPAGRDDGDQGGLGPGNGSQSPNSRSGAR